MGEVGLRPSEYKALSWDEVDSILSGYNVAEQKRTAGFRMIAVQVYNALAEKPVSESEYLFLPAVDSHAATPAPTGPDPDFLARIAARVGQPITLVTD